MEKLKTYNILGVCEVLQCSKPIVYDYVRSGELKASKVGRKWVITESDLKEFLEERKNRE